MELDATELIVFDSPNTRIPKRTLLSITNTRQSTIRNDNAAVLSAAQMDVFDNIEKIKMSIAHFSPKKDIYRVDELAAFLELFGKKAKGMKKGPIIDELVKLYNKYDYENQKQKPVDVVVKKTKDMFL